MILNWLLEPGHPRDLADVRLCRLVLVISILVFWPAVYMLGGVWLFAFIIPAVHIGLIQYRIKVRKKFRVIALPSVYSDWILTNLTTANMDSFIDRYAEKFGWNDSKIRIALCRFLDARFEARVAARKSR